MPATGSRNCVLPGVGTEVDQSRGVELAAGQEAFVKILALDSWESGGEQSQYKRDTFYVSPVSPQVARAALGRSRPGG
jgi:hypothetical protein